MAQKAVEDFEAESTHGTFRLSDHAGHPVVLYFYPKDSTPGCTTEGSEFRGLYEKFLKQGAIVAGVSRDSLKSHQNFSDKMGFPFPLLSDPDHAVADAYGAWGERSMYGKKYMGIIRSAFVIDEQGAIVESFYKVSPKDTVPKALAALD